MKAKEITEEVKSYMGCDACSLQALVLYGEWGSGKTYYCEHDLEKGLKSSGIKICRVSLFGVSKYEDIFDRLMASRLHLAKDAKDGARAKVKLLTKSALEVAASVGSSKLSKLGVQVPVKSELLMSLVDMKRVLVVLDDCERSAFSQNNQSFLGIVNEMVEIYGWHVMLVRNAPLSFESDDSIEKAVIKQIEFEPNLRDLYREILEPRLQIPDKIDFDIEDAVIDGLEGSLANARALSRSAPAISVALNSAILIDESIAVQGRAKAFSDFVDYAVRTSAGRAPKKPANADGSMSLDNAIDDLNYEHYSYIAKALAPLSEGRDVDPETIESCFSGFVAKRYPESKADIEVQVFENDWQNLRSMEDAEVEELASRFERIVSKGHYSHRWFYKIMKIAFALIELGFCNASFREELRRSLRHAAGCDSLCSASSLKQELEMSMGLYGKDADDEMSGLIAYVEEKENDRILILVSHEFFEPDRDTGKKIASFFNKALKSGYANKILNVPVACIVQSVYEGDAESQLALHSFFQTDMKNYSDDRTQKDVVDWLQKIEGQLTEIGSRSRMGALRTQWIREDIKAVISVLDRRS